MTLVLERDYSTKQTDRRYFEGKVTRVRIVLQMVAE